MLNKKKYLGERRHLVSLIKKAVDRKRSVLVFKQSMDHSLILTKLAQEGFIQSFKSSHSLLIVYIKTITRPNNSQAFVEIKFFPTLGRQSKISNNQLRRLAIRDGGTAVIFVNTDRGLLSHHELLKLKIGGRPFVKIT